ncbi:MAG TPA: folylpolyglutamate synthase/dihydrofolate synthase family protein [Terriglobia bacterium]|nr:folylpolyglutamate synthase/dihydrofolate synthase family protein [Terriglobia bacterium]
MDLAHLYSLTNEYRSIKYDLGNMRALLRALGNPESSFGSVLIAGTNGKGSVAAFLSAMMPDAGLYTSPHLIRLNERIRIGENEISDSDLEQVYDEVQAAIAAAPNLLYPPTYFEIVTAMAFAYFRKRVKFAVIEVGLGGRLDATNAVRQEVSVITSVGMDHEQFLGSTLQAIAAEKAGIIKGNEPVIIGPDAEFEAIRLRAAERLFTTKSVAREVRPLGGGYFEVDVRTPIRQYRNLRPRLAGRHQIDNMIAAIRAAECLKLSREAIETGVARAYWPGRLERVDGSPSFLLDGAHNPHAARALAGFLEEYYASGVTMIFGTMSDKRHEEMLALLAPRARRMIFTKAQTGRARDPMALQSLIPGSLAFPSLDGAVAAGRDNAPAGSPIVICGSLYLIGEARAMLQ